MTYRIRGLDPRQFKPLFAMNPEDLGRARAKRVTAGAGGRYPCRVSLRDADPGDELALVHFTNHDVETPYRNAFAIYVREAADEPADYVDELPPVLRARPIALRGYDAAGNLAQAAIALSDDVDRSIRTLLDNPVIAYIDAHNAMHGCFAARIERHGEGQ